MSFSVTRAELFNRPPPPFRTTMKQELVESGVDGKSPGGSREKYESHIQIDNLTIVFASSTVILVRQTKVYKSVSPTAGFIPERGEHA